MTNPVVCATCGIFLFEPYIQCVECKNPLRFFCLQCFAKGREYESHKNNHMYTVLRNNFTLFDPDWMASEELKLLDAIVECGIGNWSEISRVVGSKSKSECEEHYFKYYIFNPKPPLPKAPKPKIKCEIHPTPVSCTAFSQDPPRPIIGSSMYQEMAGYMPARGDFTTEFYDYAELDISHLDFSDNSDPSWNELQKAVLNIYLTRLKERARRKWIISKFGLINIKRNHEDWKRYSPLGKTIQERMKGFMKLFHEPEEFDKLMESLLYEQKTRHRIRLLQESRSAGLTRLHSISAYLRLRRRREERQKSRTALDDVLSQIKDEASCHQFIRKQVLKENSQGLPDAAQAAGRRSAPPINIAGMPGYEKLSAKERELCASLRLLPQAYLQYKSTLLNEYRKLGHLRLANARSVIKIDVNKTRKIYDLLLEDGLVTKD